MEFSKRSKQTWGRGIKHASIEELNFIYGNIISTQNRKQIREISPVIERR
jgi:hypothetical protein